MKTAQQNWWNRGLKEKQPVSLFFPSAFVLYSLWFPSTAFLPAGVCFWLLVAVVNPASFWSGQFGWRRVRLPHSSSRPRPFLPGLPPCQPALLSGGRRRSDANHTWRRATPPRLGYGQNAYWPTLLPQVSVHFCSSMRLIFDTEGNLKSFLRSRTHLVLTSALSLIRFRDASHDQVHCVLFQANAVSEDNW